jgi:hypothetical protein
MGAERAAQIAEMESMGFERSQIDAAMRAAFYNSERAIEYLLTVSKPNFVTSKRLHDHRVSQKTSNTRPDLLLRLQLHKAKARQLLLLPLLAKEARSQ